MTDFTTDLLQKIQNLCAKHSDNIDGFDSNTVINEIVGLIEQHLKHRNDDIYKEIKSISERIDETKSAVTSTVSSEDVDNAAMTLGEVVQSTEEATDTILDMAEHIQTLAGSLSDKEAAGQIEADISKIFEACNFQDLTGQRITKVTNTLIFIDEVVGNLLRILADEKSQQPQGDDALKSGPQGIDNTPTQDDVDKLFDEA